MATSDDLQLIDPPATATATDHESLSQETHTDVKPLERKASLSEPVRNDNDAEISRQDGASENPAAVTRPKVAAQDEKKRSKRLFGGLLSTLSQTNKDNATQKRRQEIERRQQDRLKKQREELEANYRHNAGGGLHNRTRDFQFSREEAAMRKRHHRLRATARQLGTVTRPKIYYSPTRKLAQQEATIMRQIHETERMIEREVEDFRQRELTNAERRTGEAAHTTYGERRTKEVDQVDQIDRSGVASYDAQDGHSTTKEPYSAAPVPSSLTEEQEEDKKAPTLMHVSHEDESGDEVVEAAEDMVIY